MTLQTKVSGFELDKQEDFRDLSVYNESFLFPFDASDASLYFEYFEGKREMGFRFFIPKKENGVFLKGLNLGLIYNGKHIAVYDEGGNYHVSVHKAEYTDDDHWDSVGEYTVSGLGTYVEPLFQTMYLAGVDENKIVLLFASSVAFLDVGDSSVTLSSKVNIKDLPSCTKDTCSFYNVQSGIIVEKSNKYYFLNASETGKDIVAVSINDKIGMSSGVFTVDKRGYLYVNDRAAVYQYEMSKDTIKQRSLAIHSSSVKAIHYDYYYDMIYFVGVSSEDEDNPVDLVAYYAPAGEEFSLQSTMSTTVQDFKQRSNFAHWHSLSSFVVATFGSPKPTDMFGVRFTTQKCSTLSETNCYGNTHYCRFSLNSGKCKAIPDCKNGDGCVSVQPEIASVSPDSGSTLGGTVVKVVFNSALPDDTNLVVKVGSATISDITKDLVGKDVTGISFVTPSGVSSGGVSISFGKKEDSKAFTFYDCSSKKCTECLADPTHSECIWISSINSCNSSAISKEEETVANKKDQCPVINSVSATGVAAGAIITLDLNPTFDTEFYTCLFKQGSKSVPSDEAYMDEFQRLNCKIPNSLSPGVYRVVVPAFKQEYETFTTDSAFNEVIVEVADCTKQTSGCGACAAVQGCTWCLQGTSFICTNDAQCPSQSVGYSDSCPTILNKLYVDGTTHAAGNYTVTVELAHTNLRDVDSFPESSLKCKENGAFVDGVCKVLGENSVRCECTFTAHPSTWTTSTDVEICYSGNTWASGKFYTVNCSYKDFDSCFSDESGACVWDLKSKKCVALPTDHSSVTWVTGYPQVTGFSSDTIDTSGQMIGVKFSSMVNDSDLAFDCLLVDDDGRTITSTKMEFGDETMGYCNFSVDFTSSSKLDEGTRVNFTLKILLKGSSRRVDSNMTALFQYLNTNTELKITACNCGANNLQLDCSTCRGYQGCFWSKKLAKCTTILDETSSKNECPLISSISPKSGIFDKGNNITLQGQFLIEGLTVHFTSQKDKTNVVEGAVMYINSETVNVTLEEDMDPARYNLSVTINKRRFANTDGMTLEASDRPLSVGIILAIAIPVAVVVIALIVLSIVLIKKRGLHPYNFDVNKKPDFTQFSYATDIWNSGRGGAVFPDDDGARNELRSLLQNPHVCNAICKATSSTEADKFTGAMVYVNATNGHCLELLMTLVDQEVESVPNSTQLFRGNSLASKAFRAYSRMVGLNYLWMTLARFIHELNHLANVKEGKKDVDQDSGASGSTSVLSTEFEVDPTKLAAGADEESQSYALSQRARQLVLCIINSTQHLPPELRAFAVKLTAHVTHRFPEAEHIAIGGTFFLRFICPAIIAPHSYGLLMSKDRKNPVVPSDRLQRQLILLGKVLQNLANGVLFGKKEPFMIGMNDFISSNLEQVNDWMEQISKGSDSFSEQPGSVPQKTVLDSYNFLASHIQNNMPKIRAALQEQNAPADLAQRLERAVGN